MPVVEERQAQEMMHKLHRALQVAHAEAGSLYFETKDLRWFEMSKDIYRMSRDVYLAFKSIELEKVDD